MRIKSIHFVPYTLDFPAPVHTSRGVLSSSKGFVVRVESKSGFVGVGEVAPLPEFGTETVEEAERVLDKITRRERFMEWPDSLESMREWSDRMLLMKQVPSARFGLESALLAGICAKSGIRMEVFLAGRSTESIRVNSLLSGDTATVLAYAERAYQQGYSTLKVKVGSDTVKGDATTVHALREMFPAISLRVDANGAWTVEQANEFLSLVAADGLEYIEDPLPPDQLDDLPLLQKENNTPIAIDEGARSLEDVSWLLDQRLCHALVLKPSAIGSYHELAEITKRAAGTKVILSRLYEGEIGISYLLGTAAAFGSENSAHGLASASALRGRQAVPDVRTLAEKFA